MVWGFPERLSREADSAAAFEEYLSHFPGMDGYSSYLRAFAQSQPSLTRDEFGDRYTAQIHWSMDEWAEDEGRIRYLQHLASWYAGDYYFLPAVDSVGALHPLMAWWGVLYTLSMVARYEPAAWINVIDINSSRYARPVERLLDVALDTVPQLIARAVLQVS